MFNCIGDCHIFLTGQPTCTCGSVLNVQSGGYLFQGYNPYAPRRTTPPTTADAAAIPEATKALARRQGATHLSADGLKGYRTRMGVIEEMDLSSEFPTWWQTRLDGLPYGLIDLET